MPEGPPRRTVLVADDDADEREMMGEYLRSRGFEVVEAGNGVEALVQFKQIWPTRVVLDLLMPRLGGLDAIKRIRAFDPGTTVVVVTGVEDAELERQALALGAARVLRKPVALADLVAALESGKAQPVGSADASTPAPEPSSSVSEPALAGRLLVVDDEPPVCRMLERLFTQKGYRTRWAADGAAALRAVIKEAPDVVLLDIVMPRLGGIEALTAIRAIAPGVQVIMVSGQADFEVAKRALAYGAFDYVTKPIDPGHLCMTVEAALAWKGLDAGVAATGREH
ncbi:MAG: response regulator [Candidatus Rokubacteria bacterium]|nr:response regulator [Candidatus Rokubacteria bacterium]